MQVKTRSATLLIVGLLWSIFAVVSAYISADGYIDRLPNHDGYYLVAVDTTVAMPPKQRPRRIVVVVVDGLREDSARSMNITEQFHSEGQCRTMHNGELTISRPIYTVLSTAVEVARTGARNNDETRPVSVQSIWQVAHQAGFRVHVASGLPWWEELFPGSFDSYVHDPDERVDLFRAIPLGDLTIIHPLRVDTAGHEYGAASKSYQDAVDLVDREVSDFIKTLDLSQDMLIFTSDHGHSGTGGHGGPESEIANVLTCFIGAGILGDGNLSGVDENADSSDIDIKTIAPLLAVVLGVPFPRHMRAVEDPLDQIWTIADSDFLGRDYVASRRQNIGTFREANRQQLGTWLGQDEGTWTQLYKQGYDSHRNQWMMFGVFALVFVALTFWIRRTKVRQALLSLVWMAITIATICLIYSWVRGSFDFTSINRRQEFLNASVGVSLSVGISALLIHWFVRKDIAAMLADLLTLITILMAAGLAHTLIYGSPLGFPLPGRIALFLPFMHGALVISLGLLAALASVAALIKSLLK